MPLTRLILEQRMSLCDDNLSKLFQETKDKTVEECIKNVKLYYNSSFQKTNIDQTKEAIAISYNYFITTLEELSKLNSDLISGTMPKSKYRDLYNSALNSLENTNDFRQFEVFKYNLYKGFELIFWAATAVSLFGSICLIAMPMVILHPEFGISMLISFGGFILMSATRCFQCLCEFKSFGRHQREYVYEANLLGLFKPELKPEISPVAEIRQSNLEIDNSTFNVS